MKYYIFVEQGNIEEELQIKPYWVTKTKVSQAKCPLLCVEDKKTAFAVYNSLRKSSSLYYNTCDVWQEFSISSAETLTSEEISLIEYYSKKELPVDIYILKENATKIHLDIGKIIKSLENCLSEEAYNILNILSEVQPARKTVDKIGKLYSDAHHRIDEKTVRKHLNTLINDGLVNRPSNSKKGAAITQKGTDILNTN